MTANKPRSGAGGADPAGRAGAPPAIEVDELTKRYEPDGVQALAGVSFSVAAGEIFGYLGRNGAGKSTTVRILATLARATSGRARVQGLDVAAEPAAVRLHLGVVLQESALDELMSGREHLVLAGRLAGLGKRGSRDRAGDLLEVFGLTAAAGRITARYSGGMRRRLGIALALIRRPPVLFLDEPTTGLDPQSRRALWEQIRALRSEGSTVFLTTQYLAEADELSDRVAIVHGGVIAAVGTPAQLKDQLGTTTIRARTTNPQAQRRVVESTAATPDPHDGDWVRLTVDGDQREVLARLSRVAAMEGDVDRVEVLAPTLEDVFVNVTGTEIEGTSDSDAGGGLAVARRTQGVTSASGSRL